MTKASPMAKAGPGPAGAPAVGKARGGLLWWGGLACGVLMPLSPGTTLLLAVMIAPVVIVAMLEEEGALGQVTLAAFLLGLAATVHPMRELWDDGASLGRALTLVQQPMTICPAWVAISAGWLTSEIMSLAARGMNELAARAQRHRLAADLVALEVEWGPLAPLAPPAS